LDIIGTKVLRVFLLLPLLRILLPLPPPPTLEQKWVELVCNEMYSSAYGIHKSENSPDYAQKHRRQFTFMSSASGMHYSDHNCDPKASDKGSFFSRVFCLIGLAEPRSFKGACFNDENLTYT
jgi:hypothetical protein